MSDYDFSGFDFGSFAAPKPKEKEPFSWSNLFNFWDKEEPEPIQVDDAYADFDFSSTSAVKEKDQSILSNAFNFFGGKEDKVIEDEFSGFDFGSLPGRPDKFVDRDIRGIFSVGANLAKQKLTGQTTKGKIDDPYFGFDFGSITEPQDETFKNALTDIGTFAAGGFTAPSKTRDVAVRGIGAIGFPVYTGINTAIDVAGAIKSGGSIPKALVGLEHHDISEFFPEALGEAQHKINPAIINPLMAFGASLKGEHQINILGELAKIYSIHKIGELKLAKRGKAIDDMVDEMRKKIMKASDKTPDEAEAIARMYVSQRLPGDAKTSQIKKASEAIRKAKKTAPLDVTPKTQRLTAPAAPGGVAAPMGEATRTFEDFQSMITNKQDTLAQIAAETKYWRHKIMPSEDLGELPEKFTSLKKGGPIDTNLEEFNELYSHNFESPEEVADHLRKITTSQSSLRAEVKELKSNMPEKTNADVPAPSFSEAIPGGAQEGTIITSDLKDGDKFVVAEGATVTNSQGKEIKLNAGEVYTKYIKPNGKTMLQDGKKITIDIDQAVEIKGTVNDVETGKAGGVFHPVDKSKPQHYPTAEDYVASKDIVYHGTNQPFEVFDKGLKGQDVKAESAKEGYWFTASKNEAQDYADYSARRSVPDQVAHEAKVEKLLERIDVAKRQRNYNLQGKLTEEVEELEATAIQAEPSGQRVIEANIEMKNPLVVDASVEGFSHMDAIEKAKKGGYDSIIFENIFDSPTGIDTTTQYVVFDKSQIKTKAQLTKEWQEAQKVGDDKLKIFRMDESMKVTNTQGQEVTLPKGHEFRAYDIGGGKVRLQNGKQVTVYEGELSKLSGKILPEGKQPKAGGEFRPIEGKGQPDLFKVEETYKPVPKEQAELLSEQVTAHTQLELRELQPEKFKSTSTNFNEHIEYLKSIQLPADSKIRGIQKNIRVVNGKRLAGTISAQEANRRIEALKKELLQTAINEGVSIRSTKGGKVGLAIRQAGTYVPAEFSKYDKFKDVEAHLSGGEDITRSIQNIDGALSGKQKAAMPGQAGAAERYVLWPSRDMMIQKIKYIRDKVIKLKKIAPIKPNSKTDVAVNEILRTISTQAAKLPAKDLIKDPKISAITKDPKVVKIATDLRKFYDEIIEEQNLARELRSQEPIPYRGEYSPEILRDATIWERLSMKKSIPEDVTRGGQLPDYIKPNKPFNPREMARSGGIKYEDQVKSAVNLAQNYASTAAKDIFNTSIIQNNKAFIQQLETMGYGKSAKLIADWTANAYGGIKPIIDRALNLPQGVSKAAHLFNQARNIAVFPFNVSWTLLTQTSSLAMTVGRYGATNTLKGFFKFMQPKVRKNLAEEYYSYIVKSVKQGNITRQDARNLIGENLKIYKTPGDMLRDFSVILTEVIEKILTGSSIEAAKIYGAKKGIKGKALTEYASDGGAKTQSMYNDEDKPQMLTSLAVKTIAPYQTFVFEVMNSVREWSGKTGTPPDDQMERIWSVIRFIGAAAVFHAIAKKAANKEVWSWKRPPLPFAEFWYTPIMGKLTGEYGGASGLASPVQTAANVGKGINDILEAGSWRKLRNELTTYLPGFINIPGGVQLTRTIDALVAYSKGGVFTRKGKKIFALDTKGDLAQAIFSGVWSTKGGRAYWDKREGKKKDKKKKQVDFIA